MADQTPFDSRANQTATFDDISPVLLEDHLRKQGVSWHRRSKSAE